MTRIFAFLAALLWFVAPASAQVSTADVVTTCGSITYTSPTSGSSPHQTQDTTGAHCVNAVLASQYPSGSTLLGSNTAGTTGAVVGTLAAASGKTTYLCGFNVQSIGGTATSGPIVVAGLLGGSQTYQTDVNSATVGKTIAAQTFNPCIPASTTNTAITVTTTANGTATAVNVNSWGFRF